MALEQRTDVLVEPFGVRDNRRFHVIGEGGRLINGKQLGELQQITPTWDEETARLVAPVPRRHRSPKGPIELGEAVTTNFFGRRDVEGRLVDGPWSDAI